MVIILIVLVAAIIAAVLYKAKIAKNKALVEPTQKVEAPAQKEDKKVVKKADVQKTDTKVAKVKKQK